MKQSPILRVRAAAGFTLVETMVALLVVMLIMGAAMMAVTNAVSLSTTARLASGVNGSLRAAMDVVVRDMLQSGQGLPGSTRRVGVPTGTGSAAINRPIPAVGGTNPAAMTTFAVATSLPAISVGYQLGYNNSDVITILASDGIIENVGVTAASGGTSSATVTVAASTPISVTNGGANNVAVGDLIDVRNAGADVLMTVTGVSGQTINFAVDTTNDTLGLNQFGNGLTGSATQVLGAAPTLANVSVTRVKMISYYLFRDVATDSRYPRLIRRINGRAPSTVAFGIENFTMTYDLATVALAFRGVFMNNNDIVTGTGACVNGATPRVCSPDWIRKINVVIAGRSIDRTAQNNYITNSLFSEVDTRSLAFQERYR